jgi:predicted dehydrogenase
MNTAANSSVLNRRKFLKVSGSIGAMLAVGRAPALLAAGSPGERLVVGVIGLGRGMAHISGHMGVENVAVAYVCDVDDNRLAGGHKAVASKQTTKVDGVKDFRRILDDKSVDAISIAMPNFWHTSATVLACAAGKHVYVEKPGSHNARESEWIVAAARKHNRKVQMGNQRRSVPEIIEAIAKVQAGEIGKPLFARCWYDAARESIGKGKPATPPPGLDWNLWQGPCPERPYVDNLVPYNWHWRWHYGGGELANNGIHGLDLARWGLGVEIPRRITFNGGRYHYDDDQETPDTGYATFDFGDRGCNWDNSSCLPRAQENHAFCAFYGEQGVLAIGTGADYKIYDAKGKERAAVKGKFSDLPHFQNFADAIRNGAKLNSEIGEGQKSTLLCHLGNIAYRSGHTLHLDPKTGKILNDPDALKLWRREYRPGWEPKV